MWHSRRWQPCVLGSRICGADIGAAWCVRGCCLRWRIRMRAGCRPKRNMLGRKRVRQDNASGRPISTDHCRVRTRLWHSARRLSGVLGLQLFWTIFAAQRDVFQHKRGRLSNLRSANRRYRRLLGRCSAIRTGPSVTEPQAGQHRWRSHVLPEHGRHDCLCRRRLRVRESRIVGEHVLLYSL